MEISGEGLDEVLIELYEKLLESGDTNVGSRGSTVEMLGVSVRVAKPRARLSRSESRGKPFSALGELLWYLSGSDKLDFIRPYVPEYVKDATDGVIHGAYGPRLYAMRGINQVANVCALLTERPSSRRAVIQLYDAEDIAEHHKEIPCTTTIQLHIRGGRLHVSVTMRSNDAYWGLPHDVFCFTMLQEMLARRLAVEVGEYYHYAGSMHIYEDYIDGARAYVGEGHQKTIEMPPMPDGDPFALIDTLLRAEEHVRAGKTVAAAELFADPYWADIVRMIQVFWARGRDDELAALKAELAHPIYGAFLQGRIGMKPRQLRPPTS
ncbi:MAG: thymidylate synthase [Hyphomicrobiales bacterium]|jgi:thymidylate synthase